MKHLKRIPATVKECLVCESHRKALADDNLPQYLKNLAKENLSRHMKAGKHYTIKYK